MVRAVSGDSAALCGKLVKLHAKLHECILSRATSIAKTEIKTTNIEAFVLKLPQKKNFIFFA